MLTRGHFAHAYTSRKPAHHIGAGTVKVKEVNGIPQTWAISRPSASPASDYSAPLYLSPSTVSPPRQNSVLRGGTFGLALPGMRVEMDPSDVTTWQRNYRFTT